MVDLYLWPVFVRVWLSVVPVVCGYNTDIVGNTIPWIQRTRCIRKVTFNILNHHLCVFVCVCAQILVGELCAFFTKAEGTQEKTIVTADCCYFNPLLRRIIRFLGEYCFVLHSSSALYRPEKGPFLCLGTHSLTGRVKTKYKRLK